MAKDILEHSPTKTAAFFDLDKTIIATSSALAFGREFMNKGYISLGDALQLSLAKASFMRVGQTSSQMDSTRDQLAAMVAGWDVDEVSAIASETLHSVVTPAVYAEARELIQFHKDSGHQVVIVSASEQNLVQMIAREMGIEHVVATELEVADNKFTGRILNYLKGPAKAEAIRAIVEEQDIDLASSYAYSDSATDIPMLNLVGNPVVVNPDRALRKFALEAGWDIRIFKDPIPLFNRTGTKSLGIGATVVAGAAALVLGWLWLIQKPSSSPTSATTA